MPVLGCKNGKERKVQKSSASGGGNAKKALKHRFFTNRAERAKKNYTVYKNPPLVVPKSATRGGDS